MVNEGFLWQRDVGIAQGWLQDLKSLGNGDPKIYWTKTLQNPKATTYLQFVMLKR